MGSEPCGSFLAKGLASLKRGVELNYQQDFFTGPCDELITYIYCIYIYIYMIDHF